MADDWRVEADDGWLAAHSSNSFARIRRRLSSFGRLADAVSHAEHGISHTAVSVDLERCRRCGALLVETHRLIQVDHHGVRVVIGAAGMCRRCQAEAWLFHSRMPATTRARRRARKVVL